MLRCSTRRIREGMAIDRTGRPSGPPAAQQARRGRKPKQGYVVSLPDLPAGLLDTCLEAALSNGTSVSQYLADHLNQVRGLRRAAA